MMRWCAVAVICLAGLFAGCSEEDNPTPQVNESVAHGGRKLVPMEAPRRGDASIISPAAGDEEVRTQIVARLASPSEGGETGPAVEVDDSTARSLVEGYVEMLSVGAYDQLPDILIEDVQENARTTLQTLGPLLTSRVQLLAAIEEKFPEEGIAIVLPDNLDFGLTQDWIVTDVEETSDTAAEATLAGGDDVTVMLPVQLVGDGWRIEAPFSVALEADDEVNAVISGAARRFDEIRAEIADGTIENMDAATAAVDEAMRDLADKAEQLSPL